MLHLSNPKIRMNRYYFLSGAIGAIVVILVGLVILTWMAPIDVAPVYMLNPEVALDSIGSVQLDSLRCEHMEVLKDLESKGVLLSPAEYTSHISSFYNSLIAVLVGMFVIFSIGSIYVMKATSKREIEELKQEVKHETRTHILEQLNNLLNDSIAFKETTVTALYGRIEDDIVTSDQIETVASTIEKLQNDIQLLYDSFNEIEEHLAANETISDSK